MDFQRLFDIFPYQLNRYPQERAMVQKEGAKWQPYSTASCIEQSTQLSAGLLDIKLEKGDRLALLFHQGTVEWFLLDQAASQIGVIIVPIHASSKPAEIEYILKDAAVKIAIVSNDDMLDKLNQVKSNLLDLKKIFCLHKKKEYPNYSQLKITPTQAHLAQIDSLKISIHEDDLATIIYTSGTTGNPKGVMLSHKNIVSNIKSTISLVPVNCDKKSMSFLPVSHIFERMVIYTYFATGASLHFAENLDKIIDNIQEIKPHFITSVPRLLERIYLSIKDEKKKSGKLRKSILSWSINLGERFEGKKQMSIFYWLKLRCADFLVYRKWRKILGGKIEGVIVGAAALPANLGRLFSAAGIDIREGYGLTETSPVVAFNRFEPGGVRFGTVGIPIPGVDIRIDNANEEGVGEILVKGPNVMMGYYNQPELTAKVLNQEGWFSTGDVGKIVFKKFLQITDRKKDIFKTTSGKYVAPALLERHLQNSEFVDQVMIVGFNRPYITALIVPDYKRLEAWSNANEVHWTAPQFMAINQKIIAFIQTEIDQLNEGLKNHEKIRAFHLFHETWSTDSGEFTPTLKLKRPFILEKYQKEIDSLYG